MMVTKLYRCPACGEVLTEEQYLNMLEWTGNGYCLCQFKDGDRRMTEYEVFTKAKKAGGDEV